MIHFKLQPCLYISWWRWPHFLFLAAICSLKKKMNSAAKHELSICLTFWIKKQFWLAEVTSSDYSYYADINKKADPLAFKAATASVFVYRRMKKKTDASLNWHESTALPLCRLWSWIKTHVSFFSLPIFKLLPLWTVSVTWNQKLCLYSADCVLFGSKRKLIDLPAQGKIKILYLFI